MSAGYAEIPYPWKAAVTRGAGAPARHYAAIVGQAIRYGLPARRRPAAAWTRLARRGVPEHAFARTIERLPARARPDLDALLEATRTEWRALLARGAQLPVTPPAVLSALSLERRAARTVFVFGEAPEPLLVLKVPAAGAGAAMVAEAAALEAAQTTGIAPRPLGQVGAALAQSVVPGEPLAVRPLTTEAAHALELPAPLADAMAALERLGAATAQDAPPSSVVNVVESAATYHGLSPAGAQALRSAARRVSGLRRAVLGHRDTSPQNLHCTGDRLAGIVDWELAEPRWLPGLDIWIASVSYIEHCVGLDRWSSVEVLGAVSAAWDGSPFVRDTRAAAERAVAAAGLDPADAGAIELAFFGIRLANRMERPGDWATSPDTAARMVEIAAAA